MGLFDKKICCICGKKAGMFSREKLKNKTWLCGNCVKKCSNDLTWEEYENMTAEDVKAHLGYMEQNERVFQGKFKETGRITSGLLRMDSVLSYDLDHGWWTCPGSSTHDLYGIGSVKDCRFDMDTSSIPDSERDEDDEDEGGGLGFLGGLLDAVLDDDDEDELKPCPPGRRIDKMYVDVRVEHPWVKKVRIYTMDEISPEPADVRRGYDLAEEILSFFRSHRGDSVDPVE